MSRHCWNCEHRLDGDPSTCPRCRIPLVGTERSRITAIAASSADRKSGGRRKTGSLGQKASPGGLPISLPDGPSASAAVRVAAAGRAVRVTAANTLRASFGFARKAAVTGAALSARTAGVIGTAAGRMASSVRGTSGLVPSRPQGAAKPLYGEVLQNENVRTMTDVAERLLRDARAENAKLAKRISALEALFAEQSRSGGTGLAVQGKGRASVTGKPKPTESGRGPARSAQHRRRNGDEAAILALETTIEPVVAANSDAISAVPSRRRRTPAARNIG